MLTATYSFVALAAEQDNARKILSRLQQFVKSAWHNLQGIDALETALQKSLKFERTCRQRKLERYVVPALRRASEEAAALLAELDRLAGRASALLRSVHAALADMTAPSAVRIDESWYRLHQYCEDARVLLEREERELFPLARRVLSVDDWFGIAAQFLSEETAPTAFGRPRAGRRERGAPVRNIGAA